MGRKKEHAYARGTTDHERNAKSYMEVYNNFINPFTEFILYVKSLKDYNSGNRKSDAVQAWSTFSQWVSENKINSDLITFQSKNDAFLLASQSESADVRPICFHCYNLGSNKELLSIHRNFFKQEMLFVELSEWVTIFHMQNVFSDEVFVVPMILCNASKPLMKYLSTRVIDQKRVLKLLDNLLESLDCQKKIEELAVHTLPENFPKNIKFKKLCSPYFLRDLLHSLAKKFKTPISLLPGLDLHMKLAFVMKIISDWQSHNISDDGMKEQIDLLAKGERQIQNAVVSKFEKVDVSVALYWSEHFNIALMMSIGPPENPSTKIKRNPFTDEDKFYKVPDIDVLVQYIDSLELTQTIFDYISKLNQNGEKVVGIDSEWKPSYSYEESPPSLFQVAFCDKIFIIDVQVLLNEKAFWVKLNNQLLQNPNIIKIGYSLANDKSVFHSVPSLSFVTLFGSKFVDVYRTERWLKPFVDAKKISYPYSIPKGKINSTRGLKSLVWKCLGKPLDKRETLSNWGRRPLRPAQIHYAALDAYVLIKVYDCLNKMSNTLSTSVDKTGSNKSVNEEFVPECINIKKNKSTYKRRAFGLKQNADNASDSKKGSKVIKDSRSSDPSDKEKIKNGESSKMKLKNLQCQITPFKVCTECFEDHNTRKCPRRKKIHLSCLNIFVNIRNLSNACEIDVLCSHLIEPIEFMVPNLSVEFPELGHIALSVKKIVHNTHFVVSRTFARAPAIIEFLLFYNDFHDLLELIIATLERVIDINKSSYDNGEQVCAFCFKIGHKKANCFAKKNFKTAQEGFLLISLKLKEMIGELLKMETIKTKAEESFKSALEIPSIKRIIKKYPKCSFCHCFGHSDVICRNLSSDLILFRDALERCESSSQKCAQMLSDILS